MIYIKVKINISNLVAYDVIKQKMLSATILLWFRVSDSQHSSDDY